MAVNRLDTPVAWRWVLIAVAVWFFGAQLAVADAWLSPLAWSLLAGGLIAAALAIRWWQKGPIV